MGINWAYLFCRIACNSQNFSYSGSLAGHVLREQPNSDEENIPMTAFTCTATMGIFPFSVLISIFWQRRWKKRHEICDQTCCFGSFLFWIFPIPEEMNTLLSLSRYLALFLGTCRLQFCWHHARKWQVEAQDLLDMIRKHCTATVKPRKGHKNSE